MQSKAETFDGFTFKFFSTFQLKKTPSIYCSSDDNKNVLFNFQLKKTHAFVVLLIKTKMFYLTLLHCYVQSKINNIMHIG